MTEWRRRRLWTSLGAAALLAPVIASSATIAALSFELSPALAQQGGDGGGEGGEGGGETGINALEARRDPVVYHIALDVIRAHYLAGLTAARAGDRDAAAEMFVHPVSEVYYDLLPALIAQGVPAFEADMMKAGELAFDGADIADVEEAVARVLAATDAAAALAPATERSSLAIEAAVLSDMVDRAAAQYRYVTAQAVGDTGDAWLDGQGFRLAAKRRAGAVTGAFGADLRERLDAALALLDAAYDGGHQAGERHAPEALLAASSRLALAASRLR